MAVSDVEVRQQRDLRRMKAGSTGLLLIAIAGYVAASRWRASGGPGWASYVAAAAEAGTIGGLADWFAVTALFRHPLGLPIPHTAILPTRKNELGRSLQRFVAMNFFSEPVIRDKIARFEVAARVAEWLTEPAHAARVGDEIATVVRGAVTVLRDEDVQRLLERLLVQRLEQQPLGPPAGRLLRVLVEQRVEQRMVDLAIDAGASWLEAHEEVVLQLVRDQAPAWSPRFLDDRVANKVYREVMRFLTEVRNNPEHRVRVAVTGYLTGLADDLCLDPATMAAADRIKARLLRHPELRHGVAALWTAAKKILLDAAADPSSELRHQVVRALLSFAVRVREDAGLRGKIDTWVEDALTHFVCTYRDDVTAVISDTVDRWDATETSRKVELQVGRDLQYIRINGTVVGALAGLLIHAASVVIL